jgi:hypothetical protein
VVAGGGVVAGAVVAPTVVAVVDVPAVVGCACVNVWAARSLAFVSFGSAPNTSTAVSIPRKSRHVTTMNAGSARPGKSGRYRGARNAAVSAKTMKTPPTTASPTM